MKKFLALFFLMASTVMAQNPPAQTTGPFGSPDCQIGPIIATGVSASPAFDNRFAGCTSWTLYEYSNGHQTAISLQLEENNDTDGLPAVGNFTIWPVANLGPSSTQTLTSTSQQSSTYIKYFPWVRVNVTSFTGLTSTAQITYYALGFRPKFGAIDTSSTGTAGNAVQGLTASGNVAVGNPVLIAGVDSIGHVQSISSPGGTLSVAGTGFGITADGQSQFVGFQASGNNAPGPMATGSFYFNGLTEDKAVKCPTAVPIVVAAAATQQIVAPNSGQLVRVCAIFLSVSTAGTLSITEGTGATCGTGTTTIGGQMTLPVGMAPMFSSGTSVMQTNVSGDGLCLTSGTAAVQGWAQVEHH